MNEKGSSALVYNNVLQPTVKNKEMNADSDRDIVNQEIDMILSIPNRIGVPLLRFDYPHIQMQKMDETFLAFVERKKPPLNVLLSMMNTVCRYCAILYASGIFHCDLMAKNVMLFYRTPTGSPLIFLIDYGLSYKIATGPPTINGKRSPRIVDVNDRDYDFMFFLYSCLHRCSYLMVELIEYYGLQRLQHCFEKYHSNGRNHQWYREGTLYEHFGWRIDLAGS